MMFLIDCDNLGISQFAIHVDVPAGSSGFDVAITEFITKHAMKHHGDKLLSKKSVFVVKDASASKTFSLVVDLSLTSSETSTPEPAPEPENPPIVKDSAPTPDPVPEPEVTLDESPEPSSEEPKE